MIKIEASTFDSKEFKFYKYQPTGLVVAIALDVVKKIEAAHQKYKIPEKIPETYVVKGFRLQENASSGRYEKRDKQEHDFPIRDLIFAGVSHWEGSINS